MRSVRIWNTPVLALAVTLPILALAGCSALNPAITSVATPASASLSGSIHGGQQPVAGATVSLIAPGTSGYGSAGSVIVSTVSDANGAFTLPRPYTCPANSGLTYILATGGNAGAGVNTAIAEAAILGPCTALTAATFVNITEVTTVAAAYALAPFYASAPVVVAAAASPDAVSPRIAASGASIGTSATNLQGLTNAFGPAGNLANTVTGFARSTSELTGIVPPTAEVNTLADILAACVNQGTPSSNSTACSTLFSNSTPSGAATPTDTFQAALNIATHPAAHVPALFGLVAANAPFQPTLGTAPADFSLALGFNGGAITTGAGTIAVAMDAAGNAWITTGYFSNTHTLTEISPAGAYLSGSAVAATTGFGSSSLVNPVGLAIDQNGAVYVANNGAGNLLKFNPNGTLQSTITAASFNGPNGIAIDTSGNPWIANFSGNKVTRINTSGVEATGSPFTVGSGGVDIAISPAAVWETDYQSKFLSRIDLSSSAVNNISTGGSNAGVAIDSANNVWIVTTGNGSIREYSSAGAQLTPAGGLIASGNAFPQNIVIDGLGNVFAGTYLGQSSMGSLIEYSSAGTLLSPALGFTGSGVISVLTLTPGGIAIDGSGNVWLSGTNNGASFPNYVTEIVGIAAPVVTPRASALTGNTIATRP